MSKNTPGWVCNLRCRCLRVSGAVPGGACSRAGVPSLLQVLQVAGVVPGGACHSMFKTAPGRTCHQDDGRPMFKTAPGRVCDLCCRCFSTCRRSARWRTTSYVPLFLQRGCAIFAEGASSSALLAHAQVLQQWQAQCWAARAALRFWWQWRRP